MNLLQEKPDSTQINPLVGGVERVFLWYNARGEIRRRIVVQEWGVQDMPPSRVHVPPTEGPTIADPLGNRHADTPFARATIEQWNAEIARKRKDERCTDCALGAIHNFFYNKLQKGPTS